MDSAAIVVGYDGSAGAAAALRWAVDAAVRHHASLRLVYVNDAGAPVSPVDPQASVDVSVSTAGGLLDLAVADTQLRWGSKIVVTAVTVPGPVVPVLCAQSQNARMLVLGSRGASRLNGTLPGSVGVAVAARARCPVVVVRDGQHVLRPDRPVAVAVDGGPVSVAAARFAIEEAAARRVGLLVVRVWNPLARWHGRGTSWSAAAPEDAEWQALETTLRECRAWYPSVPVSAQLVAGHTRRWLTATSRETQLMVVGARGRGGFNGLVLGSVGQSLLRLSASPVAVVSTYEPSDSERPAVVSGTAAALARR
jgi:nucleotide-binding universal stress UspA family protein